MREPLDIAIHTLGLPITGEDPTTLPLGGSETAVVAMARALVRAGNRVRVFCNTEGGRSAGVDYVPAREISPSLEREPCDLLLSCRHHRVFDLPLPARMVGLWNHDVPSPDFVRAFARGLSRASFSMFVSRFQQQEFERCVPGISRYAWVTSNGVDFDALEASIAGVARAEAEPMFLYGSRPERGLDFLLRRLWPRIRRRHPEAKLLVSSYDLGTFPLPPGLQEYYSFCRQMIAGSEGVVELGALARRDFWRELARCTAVLYPACFPEVSCMVALEAQAAGVPIVTTAAFALRETVGFAETLVGAPLRSEEYVDDFVDKVDRLIADDDLRARARARGHEHVSRHSHSWDALAERWTRSFLERFRERFERDPAGVLRGLLCADETAAARRLVASVRDPEAVFRNGDLDELCSRPAGPAPDVPGRTPGVEERVFRIPPRPSVSATILVKNEEANVRRCIESFEGMADEIIVGDTGSTDLTREILRSMEFSEMTDGTAGGAPLPRRRLVHIDFRDFAQARNELAAHAAGDYIFWQDADEILTGAAELRRWVNDNVFFDAFAVEQRHIAFDHRIESNHPVRCFRPVTPDGALGWVGCVHELVEHEANRPPDRTLVVPEGIYVGHLGYHRQELRLAKARRRNLDLLRRDRSENPGRMMGFVHGIRECLNLAKYERMETGELTERGYRYLNLGFEIWERHMKGSPERYRQHAYRFSREILEVLARHKLALRRTGKVPIEVDFSFSAQRGGLDQEGRDIPRHRLFFADVEELREEFNRRLDQLDAQLGTGFERPPETLPVAAPVEPELPASLFGIEDEGPDRDDRGEGGAGA